VPAGTSPATGVVPGVGQGTVEGADDLSFECLAFFVDWSLGGATQSPDVGAAEAVLWA
jgi:hypothetical protein